MACTLIIAGSRTFRSYNTLESTLDELGFSNAQDVTIISGCARGADQLGEQWAHQFGKPLIRMPAQWNTYGKSAGYKRNEEMAKIATHLVAFWDGTSRGTAHMINLAEKYKLITHVKLID